MRKLILYFLTIIPFVTYGQVTEEGVLYVVDSILIIDDPGGEEGKMAESEVETLIVVTDKSDIERHGYNDLDKVIFIITKE